MVSEFILAIIQLILIVLLTILVKGLYNVDVNIVLLSKIRRLHDSVTKNNIHLIKRYLATTNCLCLIYYMN